MKTTDIINITSGIIRQTIIVAIFVILPWSIRSQEQTGNTSANLQIGKLYQALGKTTGYWRGGDQINKIPCQIDKIAIVYSYEMSKSGIDSLLTEKKEKQEILKNLKENQQQTCQSLSLLVYDSKMKPKDIKQMYEQYDTNMLLRQRGHYGDPIVESTMELLLVCHRAESVLSYKYDKDEINKAISNIQLVKGINEAFVFDIENRLKEYGEINENLRNLLAKYEKDRPNRESTSFKQKEHKEKFIKDIETNYFSIIADPKSYPYLYQIIDETVKAKIEDPCQSINRIIKEI